MGYRMMLHHITKVTAKGQIVISKMLRQSNEMPPGTRVILIPGKDEIRVRALNRTYIERFAGLLGRDGRALNELLRSRRDGERHVSLYRRR